MRERTHDFSHPRWGHNIEIINIENGGLRLKIAGWSAPRPTGSDYVILKNPEGGAARYQLENVRLCDDPEDMWFADARFRPRSR